MANKEGNKAELTPARIRNIREELGLSQAEAGEVIGGGPRAFTKYEAGKVNPSAAISKLLLVLEDNPGALEMLTGKKLKADSKSGRSPFEAKGKHIEALNAEQFVDLGRRLLAAEAYSHSLPAAKIHVPENITSPDGGEDARIEWQDGPVSTRYLRDRLNQFQMKSGKIGMPLLAKRCLTKGGTSSRWSSLCSKLEGPILFFVLMATLKPKFKKKKLQSVIPSRKRA